MAIQAPPVDMAKLMTFLGQVIGELGATVNAGLIVVGDRLGLYRAMAGAGPITSAELAEKTSTAERYVREWLNAQAAGGDVTYDPSTQRYELPAEQALALADENSPALVCGAVGLAAAALKARPHLEDIIRRGAGPRWHPGDPIGAARHVKQALAKDGTWLIVEPIAGDTVESNLNPVGRAYYAFSTFLCTPNSLSQDVGLALGAQAGPKRIHDVITAAGFTRFRRVGETPFNLVYEVRP